MARSRMLVPFLSLALAAPVFAQDSQPRPEAEEDVVIIGGSVRDASDTSPEDTTLPELPTATDDGQ